MNKYHSKLSIDDKMAAGAFGRATNHGLDAPHPHSTFGLVGDDSTLTSPTEKRVPLTVSSVYLSLAVSFASSFIRRIHERGME